MESNKILSIVMVVIVVLVIFIPIDGCRKNLPMHKRSTGKFKLIGCFEDNNCVYKFFGGNRPRLCFATTNGGVWCSR